VCKKRAHHKKRCKTKRFGQIKINAKAGKTKLRFKGRIGHKRLRPGSYVVTVRASNSNGRSRAKSLRFTIVR
jgi:hypothetical protein